jgi:tripartite-type tricarboxylate transporter receptor subunit TctC
MSWIRKLTGLAVALLLVHASTVMAQGYPNRPISFVIPFPPGGGSDVLGRLLAQRLSDRLGQPVLVENRPGASATIGTARVAKSVPDGYTVLFTPQTPITIAPSFREPPPYDPFKDLTPVALAVISRVVIVAPSSLPVRDLKEFVQYARARPNQTNFGAAGLNNELRLIWELIRGELGIDTLTVPYQGAGPLTVDLVAGRIQVAAVSISTVKQHLSEGRLRGLAIVSDTRHPELPEVPTLAENGLPNLVVPPVWWGMFAPAGTSSEIIGKLHSEMVKIAEEPAYRKRVAELGLDLMVAGPAQFGELVARNRAAWAKTIQAQNLKLEGN